MFRTLKAVGLGAGLMYFFDPHEGQRRRALFRDQFSNVSQAVVGPCHAVLGDLGHRLRSMWSEMTGDTGRKHPLESGKAPHAGGEPEQPAMVTEQVVLSALGTYLMARCAVKPTPWNVITGTLGFGLFAAALPRQSVDRLDFGGQTDRNRPQGSQSQTFSRSAAGQSSAALGPTKVADTST